MKKQNCDKMKSIYAFIIIFLLLPFPQILLPGIKMSYFQSGILLRIPFLQEPSFRRDLLIAWRFKFYLKLTSLT